MTFTPTDVWEKLSAMGPGSSLLLSRDESFELLYWLFPGAPEPRDLNGVMHMYDLSRIERDEHQNILRVVKNPAPGHPEGD